ncbi:MAG: anti-sigma factor domain-containing protein [Thermoanaerobacterales bacterium]|nr:anti-sigma factor domain-containing protein [Thermoanaerobacterales bacterium]
MKRPMVDRKAVVMEVKGRSMIVMTGEGDFVRLPRTGAAQPGAVVSLPSRRRRPWPAALAAVAALLLCLSAVLYGPAVIQPAAAHVDLELGGSLSLTLDRDGHLRRVEALDEAGRAILRASNVGSRPSLEQALARLVEGAVTADTLKPGDPALVMATLVPAAGDDPPVDVTDIRAWITASLAGRGLDGRVLVLPATPDQYREAHRQGLSTGRWLVAQHGRKQGTTLSKDDLEKASLPAILDRHRLKAEDLFPGACSAVQGDKPAVPPGRDGKDAAPGGPAGKEAGKPDGPQGNHPRSGDAPPKANGKTTDDTPGTDKGREDRGRAAPDGAPPGQAGKESGLAPSPPAPARDGTQGDNTGHGAKDPAKNGKGPRN